MGRPTFFIWGLGERVWERGRALALALSPKFISLLRHPFMGGIDIEALVPDEAHGGEVEFPGQFQGHGGGGRDRGQNRDAGPDTFQSHLEADAAGQQGHQAGEILAGDHGPADDLVHGVVAAYVFGMDEDLAVGAGQGHGVGAAGVLDR